MNEVNIIYLTQPHFCKTMTNIIINLNKGKYSYAARGSSPTLFGSVSADSLKAKVGLGGDFYFDERGTRGQVLLHTASESKSKQSILYNRFAH